MTILEAFYSKVVFSTLLFLFIKNFEIKRNIILGRLPNQGKTEGVMSLVEDFLRKGSELVQTQEETGCFERQNEISGCDLVPTVRYIKI